MKRAAWIILPLISVTAGSLWAAKTRHPAAKPVAQQSTSAASKTAKRSPTVREKKKMSDVKSAETTADGKIVKTDAEWKKELTPEQYRILREHGTEPAFTGKYWHEKEKGVYACAACGQVLFTSSEKFDSGTGWPSFWDAVDKSKVDLHEDISFGMKRTEVLCKRCGGHLGHLFDDGPKPTGLRYCINSAAIDFKKDAK